MEIAYSTTNIKKQQPHQLETAALDSCPPFRVLRHRTPSSPIRLSEVTHKPFALSRVFLSLSGRKSVILVKKKAPSRSDILLSTYVVLKTKHVNPNIHVRRFQSHVRSPNLSATRPQLLSLCGATTYIQVTSQSYTESVQSYIAFFAILYSSIHPYAYMRLLCKVS